MSSILDRCPESLRETVLKILAENGGNEEAIYICSSDDSDVSDGEFVNPEDGYEYYRQVTESDGFDVDSFEISGALGHIAQLPPSWFDDFEVDMLAQAGLDSFNNSQSCSNFEFSRVVKANWEAGMHFYITFEAKNVSNGVLETFQTRVYRSVMPTEVGGQHTIEVILCRVKPREGKRKSSDEASDRSVESGEGKRKSSDEASDRILESGQGMRKSLKASSDNMGEG